MKLKKLIKDIEGIEVKGPKEIEISGVCSHSKCVSPGNLFIARNGNAYKGTDFIDEAINSGANAILTDLYDPAYKEVAQILCKDIRRVEAELAAAYYGHPSKQMSVVGITGTSGKTTVSYLVKHLLERLGSPSGLIGSIEYRIGDICYPATHTTPDVVKVHKLLKEMLDNKLKSAVMEVTSHALDQERVKGVHFDTAIFTNLSHDHLDYHRNMDEYAQAKEKLFHMLRLSDGKMKTAIVNADDSWSARMMLRYSGDSLTYGIQNHADVRAVSITTEEGHIHFQAVFRGMNYPASFPLSGRFNIYNCLAALAVGLSKGFSLQECIEALNNPPIIPGRLERLENDHGIYVFVDHAHKPGALETVLKSFMEIKKRSVITVFGCGGDRDPYKRPLMAACAEMYSDKVIVTNDNPRSEDPQAIIAAIVKGFKTNKYVVEPDRKKAIELALKTAKKDDIVLLAGKGHETYQIFAHRTLPFSDRLVAQNFLETLA